ncbi:PAAR domain-containing protein [Pseudomonas sp. PDM19]|nr:PAAR domain-containing protein [Pseudomonas sp. PDM19]
MRRPQIFGRGQALNGDWTTTGASLISTIPSNATTDRRGMVRRGDPTTVCPKCGKTGVVVEGESRFNLLGKPIALDGHLVSCSCPIGSNRIIAPLGELSSSSHGSTPKAEKNSLSISPSSESQTFTQQFLITDEASGAPLTNTKYKIITKSGIEVSGITGIDGKTQIIHTSQKEEITIHIYENHRPIDHNWDV